MKKYMPFLAMSLAVVGLASCGPEKCEHGKTEVKVENVVDAKCVAPGSYDNVTYCSDCGEKIGTETVVVPALGHKFETPVPYAFPTKDEDGHTSGLKCSVCGEIQGVETVEKLGDKYYEEPHDQREATCAHVGYDAEGNVIPMLQHNFVETPEIPATCLSEGLSKEIRCSECGYIKQEAKVLPKLNHVLGELKQSASVKRSTFYIPYYECQECNSIICGDGKTEFNNYYTETPFDMKKIVPGSYNQTTGVKGKASSSWTIVEEFIPLSSCDYIRIEGYHNGNKNHSRYLLDVFAYEGENEATGTCYRANSYTSSFIHPDDAGIYTDIIYTKDILAAPGFENKTTFRFAVRAPIPKAKSGQATTISTWDPITGEELTKGDVNAWSKLYVGHKVVYEDLPTEQRNYEPWVEAAPATCVSDGHVGYFKELNEEKYYDLKGEEIDNIVIPQNPESHEYITVGYESMSDTNPTPVEIQECLLCGAERRLPAFDMELTPVMQLKTDGSINYSSATNAYNHSFINTDLFESIDTVDSIFMKVICYNSKQEYIGFFNQDHIAKAKCNYYASEEEAGPDNFITTNGGVDGGYIIDPSKTDTWYRHVDISDIFAVDALKDTKYIRISFKSFIENAYVNQEVVDSTMNTKFSPTPNFLEVLHERHEETFDPYNVTVTLNGAIRISHGDLQHSQAMMAVGDLVALNGLESILINGDYSLKLSFYNAKGDYIGSQDDFVDGPIAIKNAGFPTEASYIKINIVNSEFDLSKPATEVDFLKAGLKLVGVNGVEYSITLA